MESNTYRKTEETEAMQDGPKNLPLSPPRNIHQHTGLFPGGKQARDRQDHRSK